MAIGPLVPVRVPAVVGVHAALVLAEADRGHTIIALAALAVIDSRGTVEEQRPISA